MWGPTLMLGTPLGVWDTWLSPVPAVKSLDEECNTPTPATAGEKNIYTRLTIKGRRTEQAISWPDLLKQFWRVGLCMAVGNCGNLEEEKNRYEYSYDRTSSYKVAGTKMCQLV